jgi:1,4-dihydroxy-2-naphthoate polyprenyltransferase
VRAGERIVWMVRLGRVHFVAAGLLLYAYGALVALNAGATAGWARVLFGYLVLMPGHLSVSYSNDLHDVEADRFSTPSLFAGGSGVLVRHPELRLPARRVALGLMGLSMLLGAAYALRYDAGVGLVLFVLLGNLLGWYYTAPPLRLAYRGLGELSTAGAVGMVVPAMGYLVAAGRLDGVALAAAPPLFLYGLVFILSVQTPDVEADRLGGKRTLVARLGRRWAFLLIAAAGLLASAAFYLLGMLYPSAYPGAPGMLGLLSLLPAGVVLMAGVQRQVEPPQATRWANAILIAMVLFVLFADLYLGWLWLAR